MINKSNILAFAKLSKMVVETSNLPRYTKKHLPKKYTVPLKIILLALKEYENKSYGHFKDRLRTSDEIVDLLDLPKIPHLTTLNEDVLVYKAKG